MIDLRSDTVTQPCSAMRSVMQSAKVGDDVYGDDPSVNRLQEKVAELLGMEAALLVPSGTQSNLIALLTHCGRGDEYLVGQDYHSYLYEAGGASALGGIQAQPMPVNKDGSLNLKQVLSLIKPDDCHFAKSQLLCLENTHNGKVINNDYLAEAVRFAKEHKLKIHLDGARVFNAVVAQNVDVKSITSQFDSVSICCSKGLGAPVGSLLAGSYEFIKSAHRWRKMVGGGMRQSGILASAIDFALDNNIERLAVDHQNAEFLAAGLAKINKLKINPPQTNMLFVDLGDSVDLKKISQFMQAKDILISPANKLRLVTHLNISREDCQQVIKAFQAFFDNKEIA